MSSATSTEDPGLRPWQFFLLAGMLAATGVVLVGAGQSSAAIIILSLTVVSASLVALGTYRSVAPLVAPTRFYAPQLIVGHTRAALEREKTLALRAIKDLEFDFAMKKVGQQDFDEISARLRARAIGLMRQLDSGGGYKAAIEREVAARLGPRASSPERGDRTPVAAAAACACGTTNDPDARFCKNCGAKLTAT